MTTPDFDRPWRLFGPDDGAAPQAEAAPASGAMSETGPKSGPKSGPEAGPQAGAQLAPELAPVCAPVCAPEASLDPSPAAPRPYGRAFSRISARPSARLDAPLDAPLPEAAFDAHALSEDAPEPLPDDAPLAGDDAARAGLDGASPAMGGARLAEVIDQRARGLDPNAEAARRRAAAASRRETDLRQRARWRLGLLGVAFILAYGAVAGKMADIAASDPYEPRAWSSSIGPTEAVRGRITDRNGRLLAANLPVHSLYAEPDEMVDPAAAAAGIARIFPTENEAALRRQFTDGRSFMWIRRSITPAERVAVHELGDPGLKFGPRDTRFYPNGMLAAHVLGGARYGEEGVLGAEINGVAGVELWFDERLRDPGRAGEPLRLSIDLRVQAAFTDVLSNAVKTFHAKGAAGVLLDARNGEILSMVSLPAFDPNDRNNYFRPGAREESPLFNSAAQGLYELGSTYKVFTAAMMMDDGLATPETMMDTSGPLVSGRFRIGDSHRMPDEMNLQDIMVHSSNVGTARFALIGGSRRQTEMFQKLGLLDPAPVELPAARSAKPERQDPSRDVTVMTNSFGHGITGSPLHLAVAYAAMVNGGLKVSPTLIAGAPAADESARVISRLTSRRVRSMLRDVVTRGTGRSAEVFGYAVGGKTGTAEKKRIGAKGYDRHRIIATFAGAFPMTDPKYVIIVTLDEAEHRTPTRIFRTAGWTAAPTTREVIGRIAPLLGLWPEYDESQIGGAAVAESLGAEDLGAEDPGAEDLGAAGVVAASAVAR
jgi:cell division protein FtsI (penicillin-binding protein 3)